VRLARTGFFAGAASHDYARVFLGVVLRCTLSASRKPLSLTNG